MDRNKLVLEALEQEFAKPYKYGSADCFSMACFVVDTLKGFDLTNEYAGRYTTLRGAQKALRKEGHKTLVTFWNKHLDEIKPTFARFGDMAVLDLEGVEHCAICVGQFVTKTERGKQMYPLSTVKAAFRI